ncbi:MAG: ATP-binding protein [Gammaproteobacteria bacterium]
MSLRLRLSFLITVLFLVIFIASSFYIIRNARLAVQEEMVSTADLTLQLVETTLATAEMSQQPELQQRLMDRLSDVEATRHLQIFVRRGISMEQQMPPPSITPVHSDAPGWFEDLVRPRPVEFRRIFSGPESTYTVIIIRADPSDEITEVWYDTRYILASLLVFIITANILLYYTMGRALAPIETILRGLDQIEKGNYELRLPEFNLPELNSIADKFNHMAQVLQRSREENRYLTQQSLKIQEQERHRLARELHDELGQSLSALKAVAVSIEQNHRNGNESVRDGARMIIEFTDHMYNVARNMMQQLRPSILDELGLKRAIQELVDQWNASHEGTFCHLECDVNMDNLGDEMSINLFRIIQEALTNIARHARASDAYISITRTRSSPDSGEWLEIIINDNGIGMNKEQITRGMGLMGINERVAVMQGVLDIDGNSGDGTTIMIRIPVNHTKQS